jgi:hypothetical protein
MTRPLSALTLLALAAGLASAADAANPEYAAWSKFPKGTTLTTRKVGEVAKVTFTTTTTITLAEVGDDKLVLEEVVTSKTSANPTEAKLPAMKRTVPKIVKLPPGRKVEDYIDGTRPGTYEKGTETLKVGTADVKTAWYKVKRDENGVKTESKRWVSEEIPGGLVKSETTTLGAIGTSTEKVEVIEFKKP